jgi:hypothetical protein
LLLTRNRRLSGYSGTVVSGFGEEQIYPGLREYIVDAVVGGEIKCSFEKAVSISYLASSAVIPFAERETVSTILQGLIQNTDVILLVRHCV